MRQWFEKNPLAQFALVGLFVVIVVGSWFLPPSAKPPSSLMTEGIGLGHGDQITSVLKGGAWICEGEGDLSITNSAMAEFVVSWIGREGGPFRLIIRPGETVEIVLTKKRPCSIRSIAEAKSPL